MSNLELSVERFDDGRKNGTVRKGPYSFCVCVCVWVGGGGGGGGVGGGRERKRERVRKTLMILTCVQC